MENWTVKPTSMGGYRAEGLGNSVNFSTADATGTRVGTDSHGNRVEMKSNGLGGWEIKQTPPSPPPSAQYTYDPPPPPPIHHARPPVQETPQPTYTYSARERSSSDYTPSPSYSNSSGRDRGGITLKQAILAVVLGAGVSSAWHHRSEIEEWIDMQAAVTQTAAPSAAAAPLEEPQEATSTVDFPESPRGIDQKLARINSIMHDRPLSPAPDQREQELAALYKQEAESGDSVAIDDGYASCRLTPKNRALCTPVDKDGHAIEGKDSFVISHADLRRARYLTVVDDWEGDHAPQK